jgi:hypothetical protein
MRSSRRSSQFLGTVRYLSILFRTSGYPSTRSTTPVDLQKCLEANSMALCFVLKSAPPTIGKMTSKHPYPNAGQRTENVEA